METFEKRRAQEPRLHIKWGWNISWNESKLYRFQDIIIIGWTGTSTPKRVCNFAQGHSLQCTQRQRHPNGFWLFYPHPLQAALLNPYRKGDLRRASCH